LARPKKNREVSIVHFSFFDLLFGAFGAFVFLMIMQVLATLNMVDIDIQKMVDTVVKEKAALKNELEKYKETDQKLLVLTQQYNQALDERSKLIQEQNRLTENAAELDAQVASLQDEMRKLEAIKAELEKKEAQSEKTGDVIKALEEENKKLEKSLDQARQKLAALKTSPLKLKTAEFPTIIAGDSINMALSAEGGSPPYSWDLTGKLPPGLSFNKITGVISGIPKTDGKYSINLQVKDGRGLVAKSPKDIAVNVIKEYKAQEKKVSPMFIVMAVISTLLLAYILWGKYKAAKRWRKIVEDAKRRGQEGIVIKI
jgi:hypothetical protein